MVEDEEHFCVGYPGLKEARGSLLKLMEQAQSGFGLLQDEEKFIRIMLHVNADSRAGNRQTEACGQMPGEGSSDCRGGKSGWLGQIVGCCSGSWVEDCQGAANA